MNILIDAHIHTIASGHAFSTVREIAGAAAAKGLKVIAITDHGPKMPGSCTYMHFLNLSSLPKTICGVEALSGVELNILNDSGEVDLKENILKKLDVVIASLHTTNIERGDENYNTNALINAMKNPYIKIIGHPGDPRYPMDAEKLAEQAAITGTAIEINEKSADPDSGIRSGGAEILKALIRACVKHGTMMIMGGDSHYCDDVGCFENAERLLKEENVPESLILNYSVERFYEFIREPKNL